MQANARTTPVVLALAFAGLIATIPIAFGCGSDGATQGAGGRGGAGGMAGAGGGAGAAGMGGIGGNGGAAGEPLTELARLRVSAMTGAEFDSFTNRSDPGLFVLDSSIDLAAITYMNSTMSKGDEGSATFLPALTPSPPRDSAGYIQLSLAAAVSSRFAVRRITYTTRAKFASNPSSIQLRTSDDAFATAISTVALDIERTDVASLDADPTGASFSIRWVAGNDFGENGGGNAGFVTLDVVVEGVVVGAP